MIDDKPAIDAARALVRWDEASARGDIAQWRPEILEVCRALIARADAEDEIHQTWKAIAAAIGKSERWCRYMAQKGTPLPVFYQGGTACLRTSDYRAWLTLLADEKRGRQVGPNGTAPRPPVDTRDGDTGRWRCGACRQLGHRRASCATSTQLPTSAGPCCLYAAGAEGSHPCSECQ